MLIFRMIIMGILLCGNVSLFGQKIYKMSSGQINFNSEAPLETIKAETKEFYGLIDFDKRTFAFSVPIASFQGFNSPLQREHFNENYMESHKYPSATFKGSLEGNFDLTKPGKYPVTSKGKLTIHGIEKERIINSVVVVENGKISVITDFTIPLVDHDIKVPTVVKKKIAEVIHVKMNGMFQPRS